MARVFLFVAMIAQVAGIFTFSMGHNGGVFLAIGLWNSIMAMCRLRSGDV